ncbi:hypothetical protein ACKFKG_26355 [Phormidesmis sp. 146-35]
MSKPASVLGKPNVGKRNIEKLNTCCEAIAVIKSAVLMNAIVRLRTRLKTLPQKALKPMIQTRSLECVKPDSVL